MKKMKMESKNITERNIDKIAALFPNCVTESPDGKGGLKRAVNFDMLRQMLSEDVVEGSEAYEFTWVGKREAIVDAHKPIRKTLRPVPEKSVNWDQTQNIYIEGDNLETLKLLQESYLKKINVIYIDPPYNTGNDFIYRDRFSKGLDEYMKESGVIDEEENLLYKNSDASGRFHSDWCSMLYSRLLIAKDFLTDDGVIFVSIDKGELPNLLHMMNEIFGESNYIDTIVWEKKHLLKAFLPKP